jgi:sulfofructose kinase
MATRDRPPVGSPPAVFVGALTLDAIALVDRFPEPDERQLARELTYAGGGPAATAAVAACRLGLPAAVLGAVGADAEGQQILASLRSEGVDVSGIHVVPEKRSGASVVLVDARRGTRAICTRPGPTLQLPAGGPAAGLLGQAAWVHVDHAGWEPVRAWLGGLDGFESAGRPRLSVDAGNSVAGLDLGDVDLFVPTVEALAREYGPQPVDELLATALRAGARVVVATRGGDGCVAAAADGTLVDVPGHAVEVLSTLGAGDVFHGALLAAVVRGEALRDCLEYANVAAALSCRGLDGRSAIPRHGEVLAAVRESVSPGPHPDRSAM